MEMCICLKDHLDAVDRRQDRASLEEEIEVEELIHESEERSSMILVVDGGGHNEETNAIVWFVAGVGKRVGGDD
ncbi:hypothetical protein L1987_36397 [Smallanthus sonchifolius]|uniref:Uncharacterized protein n=1 Tax=Smallanthus sonchifolius TaxID=185202 RepID=A0ACB9HF53_9ASTR|nr:hypothetical protein L1987_36397 [Smallanthus sonchifolius]